MELKTTRWTLGEGADAGIATITLSRPDRRNSWTGRMHTELRHLLQTAEDDPAIRVVVITGDPDGRTFCPGADSKALETHVERGGYDAGTPADIATPGYGVAPAFDADFAFFFGLDVVTIAAVNDPPIARNDAISTDEDTPVTLNPLANDTDIDGTLDPTSVEFVNPPAGVTLSPDGKTLTVPGEGQYAIDPVSGEITFSRIGRAPARDG